MLQLRTLWKLKPWKYVISCTFWLWDKRLFDLSNKFESIADLLVDAGTIWDDNYTILSNVNLKYGWYIKWENRTLVYLKRIWDFKF